MSYIKLNRKILEWEWFTDITTTHLWLYILLKANHKAKTWQGVSVPAGSFITSEAKISADTGLTREQVRYSMKKLISSGEITKCATKTYTHIFVNKWALYQGPSEIVTKDVTNEATNSITIEATNSITTTKECNNPITQESLNVRRQKPFRKPSLGEVASYCIENGYAEIDPQNFISYYEKNGWTVKGRSGRKKMSNWKLALNSWAVNEIRFNQTNDLKNEARKAFIKSVAMQEEQKEKKGDIFYESK